MFPPDSPMTLTDLTFTTEVEDEETRRIVVATFAIAPFTRTHANELLVGSVLFDTSTGDLKPAIDAVVLAIAQPDQRLTLKAAPDAPGALVLPCVRIEDRVRVKVKRDRDPVTCDAVLKVSFAYPTAEQLLALASGVTNTFYLTFEPEQRDLLTAQDDGEPIREVHVH